MRKPVWIVVLWLALCGLATLPSALEQGRATRGTWEATRALAFLASMAEAYAIDQKRFPPSVGPTPAIGSCCAYADGKCPPQAWPQEFTAWRFRMADAHRYWYETITSPDGQQTALIAKADLRCNGTFVEKRIDITRDQSGGTSQVVTNRSYQPALEQ